MGFGATISKQPCFELRDQTHFSKLWTLVFSLNTEHCVLKRQAKRPLKGKKHTLVFNLFHNMWIRYKDPHIVRDVMHTMNA